MLGPGSIPPQGAKALVAGLLRRGGGGVNVSASLVEETPGANELEFTNAGSETAVDLRYVLADATGVLRGGPVGQLAPDVSTTVAVRVELAAGAVDCAWMCADSRLRLHVWSYDGRHKRLRKRRAPTDEECFRLMYGSTPSDHSPVEIAGR
jgi:hypothetical protein